MKYNSLLFITILFLFSCKNESNSQTENKKNSTLTQPSETASGPLDTTYLDIKGNQYRYLGMIPDSLRTAEQQKLIKLINEVTFKYMTVRNNRMVFTLTKEEYLKKGIPERYYIYHQQNIIDNNRHFEENGITDVQKLLEDAKERLNKSQ